MRKSLSLAVAAFATGGFLSLARAEDPQTKTPSPTTAAVPASGEKTPTKAHECAKKEGAASHRCNHAADVKGGEHAHVKDHTAATHGTDPSRPGATPTPAAPVKPSAGITYVCPMHPEVTSDKRGRCPKCNMFLEPRKQG